MSLYGLLHGENNSAERLQKILKLKNYSIGRYRDTYIRTYKDDYNIKDGTYIVLLTRNGGGNREDYEYCFYDLATHPNYVCNWDCDWDCTYAEIAFSIPKENEEELLEMTVEKDPGEKFDEAMENIGDHLHKFEPLVKALSEAPNGTILHPDGTKLK